MSISMVAGLAVCALGAAGDMQTVSHRVEVTPTGAAVIRDVMHNGVGAVRVDESQGIALVTAPRWAVSDGGLLWIGQSVSVGDHGASIMFGKGLNNEGVALYPASVDQAVFDFSTLGSEDPIVDVADRAARAVSFAAFDRNPDPVIYDFEGIISAFDGCGDGTPLWTYAFPLTQNYFGGGVAISDNGNIVLGWKADPISETLLIETFDWAGNSIASGSLSAMSGSSPAFHSRQTRLSDDGRRAYFNIGTYAIIWDVVNAVELYRYNINASFDSHAFSGDGKTFAFGYFGYWRAIRETSPGTWTQVAQQNFTGSTYVGRIDLNEDGSRLAYLNQRYSPNYDLVEVGMYDVNNASPMFSDSLTAPGTTYQLVAAGIAMDDAGEYLAGATWGDSLNATPEIFAYDASGVQTAAIDARGSAFAVDIDPDGDVAASGHKAVHANTFGNGGDLIAFDTFEQTLHVEGYPQQGGSLNLLVPAVGDRVVITVTNSLGATNTPYGVTEVDIRTELTRLGPLNIPGSGLVLPVNIPLVPSLSCNDVHLQAVIFNGGTGTLTNKVSVRILPQ